MNLTNKEINILKQALPIIQKLVTLEPTDIQKLHQLLDDLIKEKDYLVLDSFLKDIKDLSILKIVVIRTEFMKEHLPNWKLAFAKVWYDGRKRP